MMISVDFPQTRHVPLAGAQKFRDLGAYPTTRGRTRWGQIYRADALTELSVEDVASLLQRGLSTVVDLRFDRELQERPNIFKEHATVKYHHNPVLIEDPAARGAAESIRTLDFRAFNVSMIKNSSPTFAYLLHLLGQPSAYPLVFHCRGGRDRTGVAAALVLTAAGVAREDVVQDYILSNEYLTELMDKLSEAFRRQGIDPVPILENLRLREEYLAPMLDTVEAEFGGIDGYLQSIGVTSDELTVFRSHFHVEF
ncbi:MAG: tyrosine-protein phosphatase [Chloroflexi bacterium]|nr:tyrosine-protein phosphatase [Chloroflexota bacterium]